MKKQFVSVLSALTGFIVGVSIFRKAGNKARRKAERMADKHLALFLMMNQWVQVKQEGKNLAVYLKDKGYKNIAIYGMSYAGERLLYELQGSDITVNYAIDQKADEIYSEVNIVSPDGALEDVDAIIVTSIFFMDEIEEKLSQKLSCPIISLEDILYEI